MILQSGCGIVPNVDPDKTQAEALAKEYWATRLTKCRNGFIDSYIEYRRFAATFNTTMEYRDPTYLMQVTHLTEADRLNGFQWEGRSFVQAPTRRMWYSTSRSDGKWDSWVTENTSATSAAFFKRNDVWYVQPWPATAGIEVKSYSPQDHLTCAVADP
jgi:hypothetical protein